MRNMLTVDVCIVAVGDRGELVNIGGMFDFAKEIVESQQCVCVDQSPARLIEWNTVIPMMIA